MKFRVNIIESERGWGQRLIEKEIFDDANEAYKFVEQFNSRNNLDVVPDWNMYAKQPVRTD